MARPSALVILASAALDLVACDAVDAAASRRAWLHTTLVLDNQVFLEAEPELAGGKLAKMAGDRHAFFRGTIGNYARDVAQAGGAAYVPTAHVSADAADVALVGDPHLENIGTYRLGDGSLVVEFNDLDAATYGPFHFDVRRLAVAVAVAGRAIEDVAPSFDADARRAAVYAAVRGYVDEVARLAGAGGEPPALGSDAPGLGVILGDLIAKAGEDGGAREELSDYTEVVAGARAFTMGAIEAPVVWAEGAFEQVVHADALAPVGVEEIWLIDQVLETYPASLVDPARVDGGALAVKDVARRLGAGVASYPVRRYYALVEGPTAALDDDWILEVKQVFDPMAVPGLEQAPTRPFADNGERLLAMHRGLQSRADVDPLLGIGRAGGLTFRVRERTKYQRGIDLGRVAERVADGRFAAVDVAVLAGWAGVLLARSHARARKRDGAPGLAAVAGALAGDPAGFVAETVGFAEVYGTVVEADHAALVELMAAEGPRLGYVAG